MGRLIVGFLMILAAVGLGIVARDELSLDAQAIVASIWTVGGLIVLWAGKET